MVFSIVAGARMDTIQEALGVPAVVRVMPNTPAQIGLGISVWTATEAATEAQREQALTILQALGEEVFVEDEEYLDMATALSGTGPAYVFLCFRVMCRNDWSSRHCGAASSMRASRPATWRPCATR